MAECHHKNHWLLKLFGKSHELHNLDLKIWNHEISKIWKISKIFKSRDKRLIRDFCVRGFIIRDFVMRDFVIRDFDFIDFEPIPLKTHELVN